MRSRILLLLAEIFFSMGAVAGDWVEGVPVSVQKTDYGSLHLIYVQMQNPVNTSAQCDSKDGIVFEEGSESFKEALTFAMTALASGSKFRCYINDSRCSAVTGASTTYPVCEYYPILSK